MALASRSEDSGRPDRPECNDYLDPDGGIHLPEGVNLGNELGRRRHS